MTVLVWVLVAWTAVNTLFTVFSFFFLAYTRGAFLDRFDAIQDTFRRVESDVKKLDNRAGQKAKS